MGYVYVFEGRGGGHILTNGAGEGLHAGGEGTFQNVLTKAAMNSSFELKSESLAYTTRTSWGVGMLQLQHAVLSLLF